MEDFAVKKNIFLFNFIQRDSFLGSIYLLFINDGWMKVSKLTSSLELVIIQWLGEGGCWIPEVKGTKFILSDLESVLSFIALEHEWYSYIESKPFSASHWNHLHFNLHFHFGKTILRRRLSRETTRNFSFPFSFLLPRCKNSLQIIRKVYFEIIEIVLRVLITLRRRDE